MKIKIEHPEPSLAERTGPQYWRSLEELAETPDFKSWVEREFPSGASEMEGVNRRHFVKLMAASFAMAGVAGTAGCRRPESHLVAYGKASERIKPGLPVFFATSLPGARENLPLVVESHQNRPTKVEGNPSVPGYQGATNLVAQASILDLYDPDRSTASSEAGKRLSPAQVADLIAGLRAAAETNGGRGLAVLARPSTSPSRARLVAQIRAALPDLLWAEYDPVEFSHADAALANLFGRPVRALPDFSAARRILSLECDFTTSESGSVVFARAFADTRRVLHAGEAERMSRLYQAEAVFSPTGGLADHRLRLPMSLQPAFAARVAAEVLRLTGADNALADRLGASGALDSAGIANLESWISECAADLVAHAGTALVVAGSHLPAEVHALVALMNERLGAVGRTVRYVEVPASTAATIGELAVALRGGDLTNLLILGGNPAYDAPADLGFAALLEAFGRSGRIIRHGYAFDETSLLARIHLASTHYLESWSDGRAIDGTIVPVQPLILPLFEGVSELEIIARLAGVAAPDLHDIVVATVTGGDPADAEVQRAFAKFLHDGRQPGTAYPAVSAAVRPAALLAALRPEALAPVVPTRQRLEVVIRPDAHNGDGSGANNGWRQECPDPMTKLTWDNAILVGPKLAKELGFDTKSGRFLIRGIAKNNANFSGGRELAPVAELKVNGTTVRGPLHVQPGLPDWTVVVTLGYGRRKVGRVGTDVDGSTFGYDAYPLTVSTGAMVRQGGALEILPGAPWRLANVQSHWSMEGRDLVREANVEDYMEHPEWVNSMGIEAHSPPIYGTSKDASLQEKVTTQPRGNSAFAHPQFSDPHQWGMAIDLNTCTGCNACVVACQSENNIPVVGKDQVLRGREMAWIRLDRYYSSGDLEGNRDSIPEEPQVSLMPMMCQHCERAPCEQVCPVNATVHDEQGLNVMAYNRCVGTRYCANNCPYKVRRFNFFDWNKRQPGDYYFGPFGKNRFKDDRHPELPMMQKNPEVTVRMRGVIEKCTFCVQRIENARIHQRVTAGASDNVMIPDGTIKVACQQACPTGSIAFGNVADAQSEVSRWKESDRDYSVLGYLNTRPRTTYLGRIRNPNPKMPDYASQPLSRKEYDQASGHGADHGAGHS